METLLMNAVAPTPTRTYTPISHKEIINNVHWMCEEKGLKIVDKVYFTDRNLDKMTAKYTLNLGDSDMGCMIAFQNSYDKSMSVKFAIGASVFICSNGMVVGDHTFKSKHQGIADVQLNNFIIDAIEASKTKFEDTLKVRETFKQVELSETALHQLIGGIFLKEEILRMNQLSLIQKEYRNPTHNYGVGKNNLWNVYNLATYAIEQQSHPSIYLKQHSDVSKFFINNFTDNFFTETTEYEEVQ
tara:strand:+ start:2532 stop:3260 length:729 start_codon:yes stop_codon:yes gene_type:complete